MILLQEIAEDLILFVNSIVGQLSIEEAKKWIQPTRPEFEGSHTITCFPLAKLLQKNPEQLGNQLGQWLQQNTSYVAHYEVIKGFLNLTLKSDLLAEKANAWSLKPFQGKSERVMVEFSSPNTNKPLHLGHLRNNFLGDAISRILEYAGYRVIKTNLVNDRGIHICKSMLAYKKMGNGETPQSAGLKGDKLVGKYYVLFDQMLKQKAIELKSMGWSDEKIEKENPLLLEAQALLRLWEDGDPETVALWQTMNNWVYAGFEDTYQKIGVSFDKTYYESETYLLGKSIVDEGLQKGIFYKKPDGSVWIDLSSAGLDQKLVLRADGTSVYITQDLGTADLKFADFKMQKSVYVVGNEQDYHFNVLKQILLKLGRPYAEGVYHMSYGMVDLPSGKMKSREGTVVDADDLIEEMIETARETTQELGKIDALSKNEAEALFAMLGIGALKYYLLKVDPKKRLLFNPKESIDFQGHTGPFIQYTHARIHSLLQKANTQGKQLADAFDLSREWHIFERKLVLLMLDFHEVVGHAADTYSPAILANYLFELAKAYNTFYAAIPILTEPDAQCLSSRLLLSHNVSKTIQTGMELLGIHVPNRM